MDRYDLDKYFGLQISIQRLRTLVVLYISLYEQWFYNCADNIFTVRQWCSNNFQSAKEQLEHMYKEVKLKFKKKKKRVSFVF